MNKEFVTYEQALALKELGFDEPCLAFYSPKEELYPVFQEPSKGPYFNNGSFIETLRAPLYQQAFRWFREKYNLDSFVKHLYKSTIKVGYYFSIDEYKGIDFQIDLDDYYKTYEEAESTCLKKLIEITNEKIKNR